MTEDLTALVAAAQHRIRFEQFIAVCTCGQRFSTGVAAMRHLRLGPKADRARERLATMGKDWNHASDLAAEWKVTASVANAWLRKQEALGTVERKEKGWGFPIEWRWKT